MMSAEETSPSVDIHDDCGRTITHTQTITVDPAPIAAFINPPLMISSPVKKRIHMQHSGKS
jgi:hypothetical protein